MTFEIAITLRDRPVLVRIQDHYIQDGDVDEHGNLLADELVFEYRVFDVEEDAEITQISPAEHDQIYSAIIEDLKSMCEEEPNGDVCDG